MKSKGQIARRLKKQAAKQFAKAEMFVIPATVQEHERKAICLLAQAEAIFEKRPYSYEGEEFMNF